MSGDRRSVGPPAAATEFIGRESELAWILDHVGGPARLITLVGAGGIGKTRLAAEAVRRWRAASRIPVHWVRLAQLGKDADHAAVETRTAHAVLDADFSGRQLWDTLAGSLHSTDAAGVALPTVLVMDNCEHVRAVAGALIVDLLDAVPGLTVIATSRVPLGWVDERLVAVPPLSREHARLLFAQRAELAGRPVSGGDEPVVDEICGRLHNCPLYLQLAAARLRRRPLASILRDLTGRAEDRRLRWRDGPRAGGEERHSGIGEVIEWSYELCDDKERLLLDRLSVFAAGSDTDPADGADRVRLQTGAELAAVAAVCSDEPGSGDAGRIRPDEVEALLERLADQSLVTVHVTATATRYCLVESIRVFACERLATRSTPAVDERERLAAKQRRYYRDMVARAQREWFGPDEQVWLEWARGAWDIIMDAIESSIATPGEADIGLQLCVGLIALRAPFFQGSLREMRRWTELALREDAAASRSRTDLHHTATAMVTWLMLCQGCHADAEQLLEHCVEGLLAESERRADWRDHVDAELGLPAPVEFAWGAELMLIARDSRATAVLARAREKFRAAGDDGGAAMAELFEALSAALLGPPSQSLPIARRHLANAVAAEAVWAKSWAELAYAIALFRNGDPRQSSAVARRALSAQLAIGDQWGSTWAVHIHIWSAARLVAESRMKSGRAQQVAMAADVAVQIGGAWTLRDRLGVVIADLGPFADETDRALQLVRDILGDDGFRRAERRGRALRADRAEVHELVLAASAIAEPATEPAPAGDRSAHEARWARLTFAERKVATLAAATWTNPAIAARRNTSVRTVEAQIASVLQKLMIHSREDIIGHVPRDVIDDVALETSRRPLSDQAQPRRRPGRR
ncbi:MAG: LuxR family transcriptional regulator [Mycobacteriaceae bacterium]|nr:LuxR family transcriptional regulator [Mycobacteriaceae bacterium]